MRRHLWVVDVSLLLLIVLTGSVLWDRWQNMQQREQTLLQQMIRPASGSDIPALPGVPPSVAASYMEVAQKFLFSRDRNSDVILDPPPPPPAPPPPKPMPALPLAYGVMDLGSGPLIILTDRPGGQHHGYRPGDKIGEFRLVALSGPDVVFEWDGKQIKKRIDDILDKRAAASSEPAEKAQAPGAGAPAASAAAPAVKKLDAATPNETGPGAELNSDTRACVQGDTTPAGTVKDGYRKVVSRSPFGLVCRWEAMK